MQEKLLDDDQNKKNNDNEHEPENEHKLTHLDLEDPPESKAKTNKKKTTSKYKNLSVIEVKDNYNMRADMIHVIGKKSYIF